MSRRDSSGSDLGPSALPSGVPDGSLLNAGGLQLPSHFPKGGAQGWNRTWDHVDMEPKRYSMCYRASLSELVWNLHTIYLCTLQGSPQARIKEKKITKKTTHSNLTHKKKQYEDSRVWVGRDSVGDGHKGWGDSHKATLSPFSSLKKAASQSRCSRVIWRNLQGDFSQLSKSIRPF